MENKRQANLDILTKALIQVDEQGYDHPHLYAVLLAIQKLEVKYQTKVIKEALGKEYTYKEIINHVRMLFIILKQHDENGSYSALGFGAEQVSVCTWSEHSLPSSIKDVDVTPAYDGQGKLRCARFMKFIELWMSYNNATYEQFLKELDVEELV